LKISFVYLIITLTIFD